MSRALAAVSALFLIAGIGASSYLPAERLASAEEQTAYDRTTIEEDLRGVDLTAYTPDANGEAQLLAESGFAEYAYSDDEELAQYYGLYFYVYNPTQAKLSTRPGAHAVNMAVYYGEDGEPAEYANVPITPLDHTADYQYYKFRVTDGVSAYKRAKKYAQAHGGARRYDLVGIQLWEQGAQNAQDHMIGRRFTVTGYAKGMNVTSALRSTLEMRGDVTETVELGVDHTFYRTKTGTQIDHQNQIDTVYFSVPKRLFDEYGKLQRIKAEWWEYVTKEIFVTSNKDYYGAIEPYIGQALGGHDCSRTEYFFDYGVLSHGQGGEYIAKGGWNLPGYYDAGTVDPLYYIIPTKDWCSIDTYDPYAEDVESTGGISGNRLYEYIKSYDRSYEKGTLQIKDQTISADLFEDDIDASRKIENERGKIQRGYSYYNYDADLDLQSWESWGDKDKSWWDQYFNLWYNYPEENGRSVTPIEVIGAGSPLMELEDKALSEELLINYNDVTKFRAAYADAVQSDGEEDEEKVMVLFRFAVTDYYASEAYLAKHKSGLTTQTRYESGQAYVAKETVFFNFDVIQLTFKKADGELKVLGVAANPIDVLDSLTPPTHMSDETPWWVWCAIAGGVLVTALLITLAVRTGKGEE